MSSIESVPFSVVVAGPTRGPPVRPQRRLFARFVPPGHGSATPSGRPGAVLGPSASRVDSRRGAWSRLKEGQDRTYPTPSPLRGATERFGRRGGPEAGSRGPPFTRRPAPAPVAEALSALDEGARVSVPFGSRRAWGACPAVRHRLGACGRSLGRQWSARVGPPRASPPARPGPLLPSVPRRVLWGRAPGRPLLPASRLSGSPGRRATRSQRGRLAPPGSRAPRRPGRRAGPGQRTGPGSGLGPGPGSGPTGTGRGTAPRRRTPACPMGTAAGGDRALGGSG